MKKLISVLLFLVMLFSSFGLSVSAKNTDQKEIGYSEENSVIFIPGDANGNGMIDIIDATAIQRKIADFIVHSFHPVSSDVDNDGKVTVLDATTIQMLLADLIELDVTEFSQENEVIASYMHDVTYDPSDYSVSSLNDYVSVTADRKLCPEGYDIPVPQKGTLTLYEKYDTRSYTVSAGTKTVYNLIPYTVTKYVITSEDGSFLNAGYLMPVGSLRMIRTNTPSNVRDLGGWKADGGTVKYGKIFRGGEIREDDAALFLDTLHIGAVLNIRWDDEIETQGSVLGSRVEWRHIGGPWCTLYDDPKWPKDAQKLILEYLMDCAIQNKNVYFHCAAGADRTGAAAFLAEAILGVSQSDTDKEYELTSFYTGLTTDTAARRRNEEEWINYMKQFDRYEGSTISRRVINWALSKGISLDKINAFRAAMIDGDPVILTSENIKE